MADYDALLNQATGGAADVASPNKYEDLLSAATGGASAPPSASSVVSPGQKQELLSVAEGKGLVETFTGGLARGWGQAKAVVPSLQAMYKEYTGDLPGAIESAKEAEAIQKPYGESEWNLQNINSPGDFAYWLTEKLGEQGVNLLSMAVTGGTGGLAANVAAKSLLQRGLISQGSARAMMLAGGTIPTYGLTTGMETAGTSQEQFQVTGSTQPERSLAAGMVKGALELWTPLSIGRALITPGLQLGKTFVGGVAKTTLKEGATEGAQEAIDIYARKLAQPDYSYFKDGPTIMPSGWGEGMWRLAESAAAGAAVGGVYGAGPAHIEQVQEKKAAVEKGKALGFSFEGSEAPGTRTIVQSENQPIWYHGTNSSFKGGFKESDTGGNFAHLDINVPEDGIWFTDSPDRAHGFAKLAERNNPNLISGQNIRPAVLDYKNPYIYPAAEYADEGISGAPSIHELKSKGYDALIIERGEWRYVDNKLTLIPQGKDIAVFSGDQIRHKPSKMAPPLPFSGVSQGSLGGNLTGPERITQAATKYGDTVYTGINHGEARNAAVAAIGEDKVTALEPSAVVGFTTSSDRFVNRTEAQTIAKSAKQVPEGTKHTWADSDYLPPLGGPGPTQQQFSLKITDFPGEKDFSGKPVAENKNVSRSGADRLSPAEIDKMDFYRYSAGMLNPKVRAKALTTKEVNQGFDSANDLYFKAPYGVNEVRIRELNRKGFESTYIDPDTKQVIIQGVAKKEYPYPKTDEEFLAQEAERKNSIQASPFGALKKYVENKAWAATGPTTPRGGPGPITALRQMVLKPAAQDRGLRESLNSDPKGDALGINALLGDLKLQEDSKERFLDTLEANTPRYMEHSTIVGPDRANPRAAIRYQGKIYEGQTHVNAMVNANIPETHLHNVEDGWVVNGQFMTREQTTQYLKNKGVQLREGRLVTEEMNKDMIGQVDFHNRIMTDTEIELHDALNRPQGQKPRWLRVDQSSLQPGAITAHLSDLPEVGSERIYFLPNPDGTPRSPEIKNAALAQYDIIQKALSKDINPGALASRESYNLREAEVKPLYDRALTLGLRVIPSRGAGFYYNGTINFQGLPIEDIKSTKRSSQVALLNVENQELRFPQSGEDFQQKDSEILVSLDLNKLKEGVDFKKLENGNMQLKSIPDLSKWTPGIRKADSQIDAMQLRFSNFLDQEQSTVALDPDSNTTAGRQLRTEVEKILPAVDGIFKRIGIDGKIFVGISEQYANMGPVVFSDQGVIILPPSWLTRFPPTRDVTLLVHDWIMHEVGHIVTFHFWRNLPVEIQGGVVYAWDQARLQNGMGQTSRSGVPGEQTAANVAHWITFPEFLAEQFRRWGTSSATAKTELERTWKEGGRKLEAFYKEWERRIGKDEVLNLSEPHYYFSALMDYLRNSYAPARSKLKQWERQQNLHTIEGDIQDSPVLTMIGNTVISALQSLSQMHPKDLQVQIKKWVNPRINGDDLTKNTYGMYTQAEGKNLDFVELALAAMPEGTTIEGARTTIVEEFAHAFERRGLYLPEEIRLLTKEALANRGKLMTAAEYAGYRALARKDFEGQIAAAKAAGYDTRQAEANIEHSIQLAIEEELRAHYVASFANSGIAFSEQSKAILARIMAILERIRNYFNNLGYQTKEDLIRAIFKGEMVHRADRAQEEKAVTEFFARQETLFSLKKEPAFPVQADKHIEVEPGIMMHASYLDLNAERRDSSGKLTSKAVMYFFTKGDKLIGSAKLEHRGLKGYEIVGIQAQISARLTWAYTMLGYISKDVGIPLTNPQNPYNQLLKPPQEISKTAMPVYKLWARAQHPEARKILGAYVTIDGVANYFSPNHVKKMLAYYKLEAIRQKNPEYVSRYSVNRVKELVELYTKLAAKVDPAYYQDVRTRQLFSLKRNFERDEVQGSLLRSGQEADENQLKKSLGVPGGETQDAFLRNFGLNQKLSQGENARASGLSFELSAPSSMYSLNIGRIWGWATTMEGNPLNAKDLKAARHEIDRIGYFSRKWMTINQLAQVNEDIAPLQDLKQFKELMGILASKWHKIAMETMKFWDSGRGPERMASITDTFFDLTEMKYRSQAEVNAKVTRLPGGKDEWKNFLKGVPPSPGSELAQLFKANNLKAKDWEVIRRVQNDYLSFLDEAESWIVKKLQRKFRGSPQVLQASIAKVASDMAAFRNKPYFPMMRFGQYFLTVKQNGKLVESHAAESMRARDVIQKAMVKKYPNAEIARGTLPEHSLEFMGLPAPLLREIKDNLLDPNKPGLTSEQITLINKQREWIEQFELLNDPDRTFRKRWLPSKGMPGYSLDALRVYAHYFNSGSRYLSRLAYMEDMRDRVNMLRARASAFEDNTRANAIADYASSWLEYVLEGGRDGGKFRAAVALWFLAFSPAAAGMNITQPFFVGWPKLGADFGEGKAYAALLKANAQLGKNMGYANGNARFDIAREEMKRQEYIDVGQGAELASFAESNNIDKLRVGTRAQQLYRKIGSGGMWMFQGTEKYAREMMLKSAWDLAIANPQLRDSSGKETRLGKIDTIRMFEIYELQTRLGMSPEEARAFVYAKEAIERTQFNYGRVDDAPMMRGRSKDFLIFFKFMQHMLFAFGHNGAMIHMLLLYAFFFGLNGLPGSDDLNEIITWAARRLGIDLDLKQTARKFARDLTRGTIFDETGPDLLMHGISRYGFGMGMLPSMWNGPSFDASANGSMGKIIPGFAEVMHGINTGRDTSKVMADGLERASGAGFGAIFAFFHALNDPGSVDSKKWTAVLPRAFKAEYKAYRYGISPQAETDQSGAKIVKFDPMDWQDNAEILFQALGFTPTKVSQAWEMLRAKEDIKAVYKMRRQDIFVQLQKAVESDNPNAIEDMRKAIRMYNDEVAETDPQYVIKGPQAINSLKQRLQQKQMMESTLSKTKGDIGLTQRIMDLYPGVKAERVK